MKVVKKSKQPTAKGAIEKYLKTTTLHGFKYLCSKYCSDRVGWIICCCASACCAGLLCAVLWERFLQIPALLALRDLESPKEYFDHRMPVVAVCPPAESIVELFVDKLTTDRNLTKHLAIHLARILEGKPGDRDHNLLLDQLLIENNVSLTQLMHDHMPPCQQLIRKCRWQGEMMPCNSLFEKMVTSWGICCVMRPEEKCSLKKGTPYYRLKNPSMHMFLNYQATRRLELALQCTNINRSTLYGCKFITKYDEEELDEPALLAPGYNYVAQLSFTSIVENAAVEKLVADTCVSRKDYTSGSCQEKCAERACGCRDPLRYIELSINNPLPVCNITQLDCLRLNVSKTVLSCNCLPPCKKVTTDITFESSPMDLIKYSYDPIYSNLNETPSIVIHFRVNIGLSRLFTINPTETWLTLLCDMSSWKKAAKANQKTHRERHQPEARKHLGLLEKKKDYKQRAKDYHDKGKTLKLLRKRALDKNPDEFYFHMINSKLKDGEHHELKKQVEHTPEQIKLMQTQDIKYINMKRTIETRSINKLQAQLHMTDVADETKNVHTFFLDKEEQKDFDLAKRLDTHPSLLNRKSNRPRLSDLKKIKLPEIDEDTAETMKKKKEKVYKEISKRIQREKELTLIQQKMEMKRHLQNAGPNFEDTCNDEYLILSATLKPLLINHMKY
ncbi:hypothetical protein K1T71_004822 [Dendrolimus kikuchii]|uniref:Uncharacterized protein n=1 Tax=Dendrolimus kikuchii TaxID=765133 RepID=A0ACC1D5M9_9NEOP|nr:hypothetical protein K1T71_004822 [Dendrolimus kikuchii]